MCTWLIWIPPKYSMAEVIEYLKGKNVERKLRNFLGHKRHDEAGVLMKMKSRLFPRILYNRLWRFPFKPPALLGVIGFSPWPPCQEYSGSFRRSGTWRAGYLATSEVVQWGSARALRLVR